MLLYLNEYHSAELEVEGGVKYDWASKSCCNTETRSSKWVVANILTDRKYSWIIYAAPMISCEEKAISVYFP